jgi:hypothetical protein
LTLRARNCGSDNILDEQQAQAANSEQVLNALTQIASRFRTRAGESLDAVEKHDLPLAEATTASLEALKAYTAAVKTFYSSPSLLRSYSMFEVDHFKNCRRSVGRRPRKMANMHWQRKQRVELGLNDADVGRGQTTMLKKNSETVQLRVL